MRCCGSGSGSGPIPDLDPVPFGPGSGWIHVQNNHTRDPDPSILFRPFFRYSYFDDNIVYGTHFQEKLFFKGSSNLYFVLHNKKNCLPQAGIKLAETTSSIISASIERVIESQAFSQTYDLVRRPPPSPPPPPQ
jgi:hypothetical protein